MPYRLKAFVAAFFLTLVSGAAAQMAHEHKAAETCTDLSLSCANSVTPVFAPDGILWIAARVKDRLFVATSADRGRSFSPPTLVTPEPLMLDSSADSRQKIIVNRDGHVIVAFAVRDKKYNGRIFHARSIDGGKTFSKPQPITANEESQRFIAMAFDSNGDVFSAWVDKRNRPAAEARGEAYKGAALAYSWSNDGAAHFPEARLLHEPACECCRIDVAFAGPGRPVVLFRNIFEGSVRDHAIVTFTDRNTPGPVRRVSLDNWVIDACPHHGPSLAVAPSGSYHAAWYTNGPARKGLFYAHSRDFGESFSEPVAIGRPDRAAGRPSLAASGRKIWIAWKEFDGVTTSILVMASQDDGATWTEPKTVAETGDESDHPILVSDGRRTYLSWQARREGYRLLDLEEAS